MAIIFPTTLFHSHSPTSLFFPTTPRLSISTKRLTRLRHAFVSQRSPPAVPVFITLPSDAVGPKGHVHRKKTLWASMMALAAAGVQGVAVEVWWGVVERDGPQMYDWDGYFDLVLLAASFRMKVRIVLGFHQRGTGPTDPYWLPLPLWVLEEMDECPDLAYSDRFGRRNKEYVSLGCDVLPVLKGRSPVQVYSDLMRSFRNKFKHALGDIITEVQIGMGPCGELRYPSCPCERFMKPTDEPELGEFQCYDKYMLASFDAAAQKQKIDLQQWGNGSSLGAWSLFQNLEKTIFFKSDGSWNTQYGRFFLEWYSEMLLLHGERLCMAADAIFFGTGVNLLAKVPGIHWHYYTDSHPSELTAGYYNTLTRDGYLSIARLFARYRMTMCCACFDLKDAEEKYINPKSSPEGFLRQLVHAARICNLSLSGENSRNKLDDASFRQIIKSSKLYLGQSDGGGGVHSRTSLSFNFVRMGKNMFDSHNWSRFTQFVRQMSDAKTFQASLGHRTSSSSFFCASRRAEEVGRALVHF